MEFCRGKRSQAMPNLALAAWCSEIAHSRRRKGDVEDSNKKNNPRRDFLSSTEFLLEIECDLREVPVIVLLTDENNAFLKETVLRSMIPFLLN